MVDRGNGREGFLLVEVLATMTISALLLAALFSITSLTLRASARIERQSQDIEERTRLLTALTREIVRAIPVRWSGTNDAFIFSGTRRKLAFATEAPLSGGATRTMAVLIDGSGAITRRTAVVGPAAASFDQLAMGQPDTMSSGRYTLSFTYFARLTDGREALVEAWPDPRQFPVAVQVTLSDRAGTQFAMRIKFNVDVEPGCGFPDTGRCSLRPPKSQSLASLMALGDGE